MYNKDIFNVFACQPISQTDISFEIINALLCCHTVRTRNIVTGVTKRDRQFRGQVYCKLNVLMLNCGTFSRQALVTLSHSNSVTKQY